MNDLPEIVLIVGTIVVAIMVLTAFFKIINWVGRKLENNPVRIGFKGVLNNRTLATVHLTTGTVLENVRLIGFTEGSTMKGHIPYELHSMVILEHADGRRTIIQAKSIRMIEVGPTA